MIIHKWKQRRTVASSNFLKKEEKIHQGLVSRLIVNVDKIYNFFLWLVNKNVSKEHIPLQTFDCISIEDVVSLDLTTGCGFMRFITNKIRIIRVIRVDSKITIWNWCIIFWVSFIYNGSTISTWDNSKTLKGLIMWFMISNSSFI